MPITCFLHFVHLSHTHCLFKFRVVCLFITSYIHLSDLVLYIHLSVAHVSHVHPFMFHVGFCLLAYMSYIYRSLVYVLFCASYVMSPLCYVLYVLLSAASVYSHVFHVSTCLIVYMLYTYLLVASVYSSMFHFSLICCLCVVYLSLNCFRLPLCLICIFWLAQALCIYMLLPCFSCIPLFVS